MIAPVPVHCFSITFISRVLVVVQRGGPKSLPAHPFNALIFPILRGCVQYFVIFLREDRIKLGSLQILALGQLQNFQNY